MTTERNRSNVPHPAEYAARQDELKRSLEIIYTVAESTQAQDMLGILATRLVEAIDYVRLPRINDDGSIQEIGRWRQIPTIPVVELRSDEEVQTPMVGITDFQYYDRIKCGSDVHPMGKRQIAHYFHDGKSDYTTEPLRVDRGSFGSTVSYSLPIHADYHKKDSPIVGTVAGQPNIAIRLDDDNNYGDTLSHELIHARDDLDEPVQLTQQGDDNSSEKNRLRSELRAYAVGARMSLLIAQHQGLNFIDNEEYFNSVTMSFYVERTRNKINGSVLSPNAFDPNDEIIKALDDAGLRGIYTRESH